MKRSASHHAASHHQTCLRFIRGITATPDYFETVADIHQHILVHAAFERPLAKGAFRELGPKPTVQPSAEP